MEDNNIAFINGIYSEIEEKAALLASGMNSAGYQCGRSWDINPTSDGRNYPVQVITVYNVCTVVIDVDVIVVDIPISRKKILGMNIENAAKIHRMQIYAVDRSDFYPVLDFDGDASAAIPRIMMCAYEKYRIRIRFDKSFGLSTFRSLAAEFSEKKV